MIGPVGLKIAAITLNTQTLGRFLPGKGDNPLAKLFRDDPEPLSALLDAEERDPLVGEYAKALSASPRLSMLEAAYVLKNQPQYDPAIAATALGLFLADHWQTILDSIGYADLDPFLLELRTDPEWREWEEHASQGEMWIHIYTHYARQFLTYR